MTENAPDPPAPGDSPSSSASPSQPSASADASPSVASSESAGTEDETGPPDGEVCQNCGTFLQGEYCHSCGQRHLSRLQVRSLTRTFADALLNVSDLSDGLWRTLREGARNPGRLARRYVNGERQRFVNPISYILIAITLLFIVYVVLQEEMVQIMTEMYRVQLPAMGMNPDEVFGPGGSSREVFGWRSTRDMAEGVFGVIRQTQTYITLVFCLVAAALLRAVSSSYTYAELVVFELYAVGQAFLYHVLTLPIFLLTSITYWFAVGPVLLLGMLSFSGSGFFDRSLKGWILPPLAYLIAYVVVVLIGSLLAILITLGTFILSGWVT